MFNIIISKQGDEEAKTFNVNDKQAFMKVISVLLDEMASVNAEAGVYRQIDNATGNVFNNQIEFYEWLRTMKKHDLVDPEFDYEAFKQEAADAYVRENTDFSDIDELTTAYDELISDMKDIYDIADKWR